MKPSLDAAIRAGNLAAATAALHAGTEPNRRGADGMPPLLVAAGFGQAQMVDLLLTAGADPLAIEPRMGATALHKAAQSGNADVIALLVDAGAFIDQQSPVLGNTALIDAVLHKQAEAVRALLDRGARTGIRNHWQQSALELAPDEGLEAIARLIEARDARDAERIAALTLIAAVKSGDTASLERAIAAGAPVNERVPVTGTLDDDYTPLAIAAREGRADLVRLLLDAGADPRRVIGLMRGTAVHEASYFGHAEIIRLFAAADAPIELDAQGPYNGLTPLHDAAWHGHVEAAKALVAAGAPLDLVTHAGLTPRGLAGLYDYHDLARFLTEAENA